MTMVTPLIRTKLRVPLIRQTLVPRLRLQQKITHGLRGPLTLVTAPAGFGKTTLVTSSLAQNEVPVAWLSLDAEDNGNGRFLHYLFAALQTIYPALGSEAQQLLAADPQAPAELILTTLVNDLDASGQEICLVLDDYHCIHRERVHTAVTFLLEHAPQNLHLLIASRSDPPLPLARLRARGHVVELRAADLSFTQAEAAQFLNEVMGLHLNTALVGTLASKTEGWIAGLQMAALSLREREDVHHFIEAFSGTNRHILDYLLEEVLAQEPEATQTFLLQTAFLQRLTAPLCEAVLESEGSQIMLETLEKQNLFVVPLDDDRQWYRYHHLFADLLRAKSQQSQPVAELLSRAAVWCERNGQVNEAIGYALTAQNYELAAQFITQHWGTAVGRGEIETVYGWLNALPQALIRQRASLGIAFSWIQWFTGQIEAIEQYLPDAAQVQDQCKEPGEDLPAQLAALKALVARHKNEFATAVRLGGQALSLLPAQLPTAKDAQLRSMVFTVLASAYSGLGDLENAVTAYRETIQWSRLSGSASGVAGITYRLAGALRLLGRLRDAEAACREALTILEAQSMTRSPAAGILHLALSEVLLEQNRLDEAENHLSQGVELGKWGGRLDAARNAAFAQARLCAARHDLAGALTAVQKAITSLGERPSPLALSELLALKAKLLVWQGNLVEAAHCAETAVTLAGNDQGQTGQLAALAHLRVALAQIGSAEEIPAITQALAAAQVKEHLGIVLELTLLRSLAYVRHDAVAQALADLEQALALAISEGFVRVFIEEGAPMRHLLNQWLAENSAHPLRRGALHLLEQFGVESSSLAASELVEPLSQRELEVLQIIALGKTNEEIAQQLIIARGTVKAHTSSIYRKLDVANRTEAVARARLLGLLS
ncbi:MAG: tetratricopeptide repeat protein [Ardenticatenaceae bacterium]|nr:tetratricopeptide repeat protein [Ardenticatenaceae bacterium]